MSNLSLLLGSSALAATPLVRQNSRARLTEWGSRYFRCALFTRRPAVPTLADQSSGIGAVLGYFAIATAVHPAPCNIAQVVTDRLEVVDDSLQRFRLGLPEEMP
jgi:hypothetical protein